MNAKLHGAMWKQLFERNTTSHLSLQGQIREMLVTAILDGQLKADTAVPSSRELAAELGVGRITVVLAYEQLVDEGYLVSRERKGHFVSASLLGQRIQARAALTQKPHPKPSIGQGECNSTPALSAASSNPPTGKKAPTLFCTGSSMSPCSPPPRGESAASKL
jgi:DNA-binding transcriptional regulator YhcF (GntR family)